MVWAVLTGIIGVVTGVVVSGVWTAKLIGCWSGGVGVLEGLYRVFEGVVSGVWTCGVGV